eukprot:scaffold2366_cov159-Amphora_coffeaeformis.AAC.31
MSQVTDPSFYPSLSLSLYDETLDTQDALLAAFFYSLIICKTTYAFLAVYCNPIEPSRTGSYYIPVARIVETPDKRRGMPPIDYAPLFGSPSMVSVLFGVHFMRAGSIMGNVCCGGKEESTKSTAFQSGFSVDSNSLDHSNNASAQAQSASAAQQHASSSHQQHDASSSGPARTTAETAEVDKETSEEESRLELLVQNAGRAMVAVHSTRGNN